MLTEEDKNCGIYKITSPTGKIYIGQSANIRNRKRHYKNLGCKKQRRLYHSLEKYGFENHQFDIIEYCLVEDLNCSERFWQDEFDVIGQNGLNCILQECGEKRKIWSDEMRKNHSDSMKGEKSHRFGKKQSEETIRKRTQNMKGEKHPMYGKKHKEESIQKMKDSSKGQVHTVESIQKRSGENHPFYGKKGVESLNYGKKHPNRKKTDEMNGSKNPNAKKVINIETGIIYGCVEEVSTITHLSLSHLYKCLNGQRLNKTNFKYL